MPRLSLCVARDRAIINALALSTQRGEMYYSQNLRTFEELYDRGYIKADTYSITQSMLGGELLGSCLLRAILTLCLCLEDRCGLHAAVALS